MYFSDFDVFVFEIFPSIRHTHTFLILDTSDTLSCVEKGVRSPVYLTLKDTIVSCPKKSVKRG